MSWCRGRAYPWPPSPRGCGLLHRHGRGPDRPAANPAPPLGGGGTRMPSGKRRLTRRGPGPLPSPLHVLPFLGQTSVHSIMHGEGSRRRTARSTSHQPGSPATSTPLWGPAGLTPISPCVGAPGSLGDLLPTAAARIPRRPAHTVLRSLRRPCVHRVSQSGQDPGPGVHPWWPGRGGCGCGQHPHMFPWLQKVLPGRAVPGARGWGRP